MITKETHKMLGVGNLPCLSFQTFHRQFENILKSVFLSFFDKMRESVLTSYFCHGATSSGQALPKDKAIAKFACKLP